jgi:hypothetical protein
MNTNQYYNYIPVRMGLMADDRLMAKDGGPWAVLLYGKIENMISLSTTTKNKGSKNYVDQFGRIFCRFSEDDAELQLHMSPATYKRKKKFLKQAGLIQYQAQSRKEAGVASQIYYTPFETWVSHHGLLSNGKWIFNPLIEDYYMKDNAEFPQPPMIGKNVNHRAKPGDGINEMPDF